MDKRARCVQLRLQGKSLREIAKIEKIPLSTVFLWTKFVELSDEQKKLLIEKSLEKLQRSRKMAQEIKRQGYINKVNLNLSLGKKKIGALSKRERLCVGAALYWGEGFKRDHCLGFANSDSEMIIFFLNWLTEEMKVPVEKIRLRVGINAIFADKLEEIERYWSTITGISKDQFQKPFFQKTEKKRVYPNRNDYHGVLRIRALKQTDVFRQILGMVEQLKKNSACLQE